MKQNIMLGRDSISSVFISRRDFKQFEEPTRRVLFFIFAFLKKKKVQCDIFFLTTPQMRRIHRNHKGKNHGTTVLSFVAMADFPHPETRPGYRYLGEIYLAPTYIRFVKKEAPLRYLIHGILHLCGYTHARTYDRMQMEALEKKIIHALQEQKIVSADF